ncbi:hypothetical protein DPMN_084019 [Dreissena polymorpha]|uniref:Uncharacterized protein n=1 Tax=Dreissena polymorpha TaxID=45954 RepID=A0A9D4BKG1_DREPO|nr:hypothetical protein DPMN_084019 [Dreissena polymorpha]
MDSVVSSLAYLPAQLNQGSTLPDHMPNLLPSTMSRWGRWCVCLKDNRVGSRRSSFPQTEPSCIQVGERTMKSCVGT